MLAYKLKGTVDEAGNLILHESVKMSPGEVEVIVLQPLETGNAVTDPEPRTLEKKLEHRTNIFKDLLENSPPVPAEFDADQAKWEYLKEKHNL